MGIRVLSLFDGLSCGRIALDRAGVKVESYYSSEIDKHAIKVAQHNWPENIPIGDVTKVMYADGILYTENGNFEVGKIDLLIGGSPCQSFSNLGDGSGFDGKSGLFFNYLRILKEVSPTYFLLENVKMKRKWKVLIDNYIGAVGAELNSNLFSAQNRSRTYWTNIEFDSQPKDKCVTVSDIIDKVFNEKYFLSEKAKKYIVSKDRLKKKLTHLASDSEKAICLAARYTGLNGTFLCVDCNGKIDSEKTGTLTARYAKGVASFGGDTFVLDCEDLLEYKIRRFTPVECERLQTVPIGYTDCVAKTNRYKMLGNGWTVDVIAHIFKNINL